MTKPRKFEETATEPPKMAGEKSAAAFILKSAGWNDKQMGAALSVGVQCIRQWREAHRLPAAKSGCQKIDEDKARRLYGYGLSDRAMAKRLGISAHGVYYWRRKESLLRNVEPSPPLDDSQKRLARKLFREGASTRQVADACGRRTLKSVTKIRNKLRGEPGLLRKGQNVKNKRDRVLKLDPVELQKRIRRAVGHFLPKHDAEDAVDNMIVALLEGRLKVDEIEVRASEYVSAIRGTYNNRKHVHLDQSDDYGHPLVERVADPFALDELEDAVERAYDFERFEGAEAY